MIGVKNRTKYIWPNKIIQDTTIKPLKNPAILGSNCGPLSCIIILCAFIHSFIALHTDIIYYIQYIMWQRSQVNAIDKIGWCIQMVKKESMNLK